MKRITIFLICIICLPLLMITSIGLADYLSTDIREEILGTLKPMEFEKLISFNLGKGSMLFIKGIVSFAGDSVEDEDIDILDSLKDIKVGIYESREVVSEKSFNALGNIRGLLEDRGWDLLIKAHESDEYVLVFYQIEDEFLDSLLVIVLEDNELVIVEMSGDLERIIENSLRDHHSVTVF